MDNFLYYILLPSVAIACGVAFSFLRMLNKYSTKIGYAVRTTGGKGLLIVNATAALLVYAFLEASGLRIFPNAVRPALNSLIFAVLGAGVPIGILSLAPLKTRAPSGVPIIVTAATWMNTIIESEIDILVVQEVTEISLKIEHSGVTIESLQNIANHLVQHKLCGAGRKKNMELAKIDDFAREKNFAGMIGHLMLYCKPAWLAKQVID